jgi:hypothetical protein
MPLKLDLKNLMKILPAVIEFFNQLHTFTMIKSINMGLSCSTCGRDGLGIISVGNLNDTDLLENLDGNEIILKWM